jgi:hypothetical protein
MGCAAGGAGLQGDRGRGPIPFICSIPSRGVTWVRAEFPYCAVASLAPQNMETAAGVGDHGWAEPKSPPTHSTEIVHDGLQTGTKAETPDTAKGPVYR